MKTQSNAGRKSGSKNKVQSLLKAELTEIFLSNFKQEVRNFPVMEYEKRMRLLIGILPYILPKANLTGEESEIQDLIHEKIYPEFRKLGSYLNVIPAEKKASILLALMKQLNPSHQGEIAILIKNKGKKSS